jgi:hypothetical protein
VARQAELEEFTSFVLGSQARMVRLAELLTGDRDRVGVFIAWIRLPPHVSDYGNPTSEIAYSSSGRVVARHGR